MIYDLQKAGLWKRIAAWMFDAIVTGILAVALGLLLSAVLGYDAHSQSLESAYDRYEAAYGVTFDITAEEYESYTDRQRQNYDEAYEALISDGQAMYAYNMVINLTLVITSVGILLAILLWDFVLPLFLGNGQTLGKKIFGLCLVRNDGVRVNNLQLFTRALLGRYTIETMIPVTICLMLFWGTMDLTGTLILFALAIAQVLCVALTRANCAIHDLLAGTAVVDYASQTIFPTTDNLIEYKKKVAAEHAARQVY